MANATKSRSKKHKPLPDSLEIDLFDPAMDILLRAGVGGLATTLIALERAVEDDLIENLPGGDWNDGPPWKITNTKIVFKFPDPENISGFFAPIFAFAFQVDVDSENIIDLPPVYGVKQPRDVRAQLQRGLMLTFLQHGKSRKGAKKDEDRNYEINGKQHQFSVRPITWFKHQEGYIDLLDTKKIGLSTKDQELPGTLYPGAAVRHNAFSGQTKQEGNVAQLLAAYFAPIATLSLPVNRGSAVLLVPDVHDLLLFARKRPGITPKSYADCLVGGTGDAVLQLYARIRGEKVADRTAVRSVHAYLFRPTAWASQQKSRVAAEKIEPLDERADEIFRSACDLFKPKQRSRVVKVKAKGAKKAVEQTEYFWSLSIVRPMIADNLARRRPWFEGFHRLFVDRDPANGKPFRDRLFFEREGLIQMTKADVFDDVGQKSLVHAVHHALRGRYGQIASENDGNPVAMRNRFRGEYDRWRLAFSGAKTADQFRHSICDLLSRVPANSELQASWTDVLPLLDKKWEHARDLALLALASYQGKGDRELSENDETDA